MPVDPLESFGARWNKGAKREITFSPEDPKLSLTSVSSSIPALDIIIGRGGFPRKRTTLLVGQQGSGKTLLSQLVMAQAQRDGGSCIYVDAERCLTAGHRVLKADLTWETVENLVPGDEVIGFDEKAGTQGAHRSFKRGTVLANPRLADVDVWEIELEDGTVLTATGEHRWLLCRGHSRVRKGPGTGRGEFWVRTDDLVPWGSPARGHRKGSNLFLKRLVRPWDVEDSREAGWLAGMFDGEGCLEQRGKTGAINVTVSQNPGPVLDELKKLLRLRGFKVRKEPENRVEKCVQVRIGGSVAEKLRFLGTVRPLRLLNKLDTRRIGAMSREKLVKIVSVRPVGKRVVFGLSTDIQTYIAEGFGAHNTYSPEWFATTGLDLSPDKLLIVQPTSMEQCYDLVIDALEHEVADVIVVDSITSLVPKDIMDAQMEKQDFMGLEARKTTAGVKKVTQLNKSTALILISQVRGVMAANAKYAPADSDIPGGFALRHQCSLILRVLRGQWITSEQPADDDAVEKALRAMSESKSSSRKAQRVGYTMRVRTEKNKIGGHPFQEAEVRVLFSGKIDAVGSLVTLALEREVVQMPTLGYYVLPGYVERVHGRVAVENLLRDDDALRATVEQALAVA